MSRQRLVQHLTKIIRHRNQVRGKLGVEAYGHLVRVYRAVLADVIKRRDCCPIEAVMVASADSSDWERSIMLAVSVDMMEEKLFGNPRASVH